MVLGFPNEVEADRFGVKLAEMQKDMIVQLQDAAEVVRDPDGKPHVKHGHSLVGVGAMGGAFWGMLFGLLFFVPFLGLAIGAGMGALFRQARQDGHRQAGARADGRRQSSPARPAGSCHRPAHRDKFLAAVKGANATLVRSNLTEEQEKELKHAFGARTTPRTDAHKNRRGVVRREIA